MTGLPAPPGAGAGAEPIVNKLPPAGGRAGCAWNGEVDCGAAAPLD